MCGSLPLYSLGMGLYMSGDLGGTNFRISLFETANESLHFVAPGSEVPGQQVLHRQYRCTEFNSFSAMIERFLEEARTSGAVDTPRVACFSCAGPVTADNTVKMTNLPCEYTAYVLITQQISAFPQCFVSFRGHIRKGSAG